MTFMKYRTLFFSISLAFIIPSVLMLGFFGLVPSVDFTGGALVEVQTDADILADRDALTNLVAEEFSIQSVQQTGESGYILRGSELTNDGKNVVLSLLQAEYGEVSIVRFETVGPTLSSELVTKTLTAIVLVSFIITAYVWRQFSELKYGVCAILAMLHDTVILLGIFSFLGWQYGVEVDVLFVTAVLTTLSFSIHDTIVVYDRVRELSRTRLGLTTEARIDQAVTETLTRSLNNSLTIIFALLSLALLGGESLRWFAVALLIGAVAGTYSSTFTAAPLLLVWEKLFKQQRS